MPRVLNAIYLLPKTASNSIGKVYVGRPSKWGNPFIIGRDGTREEVIEKYEDYLKSRPDLLNALHELKGLDLVCWCAPKACHAHILLKLANL